jgi:hypothetical protein
MQTLTVEITNTDALKVLQDLQEKRLINILSRPDLNSPVFPGKPLTNEEFRKVIAEAENSGSISLKEAKASWARQRKELLKLTK